MSQPLQIISITGGADGPTSIFIAPKIFGSTAASIALPSALFLGLLVFVIFMLIKSARSHNKTRTIIFAALTFLLTAVICLPAGIATAKYFSLRQVNKMSTDGVSDHGISKYEFTAESSEKKLLFLPAKETETSDKEDFPSDFKWNGTNAEPVLDTDLKQNYRTIITKASRMQPDFNGKYKIVQFGAGTMSNGFFIINLESGLVTEGFSFEFELDYSLDSKLIIKNPKEVILDFWKEELEAGGEIPGWCTTEYYIFEDDKLTLIKRIESSEIKI